MQVAASTYWTAEVLDTSTGKLSVYTSKNQICEGADRMMFDPDVSFVSDVSRIYVGRSAAPTTPQDTSLRDPVAYVDVDQGLSTLVPSAVVNGSTYVEFVGVLPVGLELGPIAECGLASPSYFWCRNLFRNQAGERITLVKDANSQITLTARVVLSHSGATDTGAGALCSWVGCLLDSGLRGFFTAGLSTLTNGKAGDGSTPPSPAQTDIIGSQVGSTSSGAVTKVAYNEVQFTVGAGTWTGSIREIVPGGTAGKTRYVFTPAITKAAGDVLVLRMAYSLERM